MTWASQMLVLRHTATIHYYCKVSTRSSTVALKSPSGDLKQSAALPFCHVLIWDNPMEITSTKICLTAVVLWVAFIWVAREWEIAWVYQDGNLNEIAGVTVLEFGLLAIIILKFIPRLFKLTGRLIDKGYDSRSE
jgi:hypothetical protein